MKSHLSITATKTIELIKYTYLTDKVIIPWNKYLLVELMNSMNNQIIH